MTQEQAVGAVAEKTGEVLNQVRALGARGQPLTLEAIEAKKIPKHMQQFLFNLALAESLI
eukprot:CAMPEP_0113948890 /NCGR_PEP_ID=MMETSP1339-20121228/72603_1 /TAXON_ID=94617 /ORGANISM="Fibrocapsa japonica" /LENGTH=59 /DNA_ID=CAMNT_0000956101 /DNA_START=41 /DNA_END=220 /DNA_ORIENTATION=+ /assembly_acc=CAM_ASM_000762